MDLEFHQVDLRYEALRTQSAAREARLLASLGGEDRWPPLPNRSAVQRSR